MTKRFREAKYKNKLERAAVVQNRVFNNRRYVEGDSVLYQEKNKRTWLGPVKVIAHKGRDVLVMSNGNIRKVADCKVQPYNTNEDKQENMKDKENNNNDKKINDKEKRVT